MYTSNPFGTLRQNKTLIPDEIDMSHMFFFPPCKAYEDFRKDVSWFNGSHTVAVVDVSLVMSADDERTISELSRFLVFCFVLCVCGGGGG